MTGEVTVETVAKRIRSGDRGMEGDVDKRGAGGVCSGGDSLLELVAFFSTTASAVITITF
jgi:hypothetical protein